MATGHAPVETDPRESAADAEFASAFAQVVGLLRGNRDTAQTVLSDEHKIHHIVRRMAFGAPPEQIDHFREIGPEATIQELLNYQEVPADGLPDGAEFNESLEPGPAAELRRWWFQRIVETPRPFEERMVLFWHGLLTTDIIKARLPALLKTQNDFFRANALASWETMLKGIYKDPAMLRYLDNGQNRVGSPNENYAREQLELFTLGIGNYSEEDVRESARALTGWVVSRQTGDAVFVPRRHDDGAKSFLGTSGNLDGDDIVDIILSQPAAAWFITRRIMEEIVGSSPDPAFVERVRDAFVNEGMTIRALMTAIFTDPEFLSAATYRSTIKSPVEFVAGVARTFGLPGDLRGLPEAAGLMGQALFLPPNVAGWPGGTSWMSSGSWFYRMNFINFAIDPMFSTPIGESLLLEAQSPEQFVDRLLDLLLAGDCEPAQRDLIVDFAGRSGAGRSINGMSEARLRGAAYLALTLPEYQLL